MVVRRQGMKDRETQGNPLAELVSYMHAPELPEQIRMCETRIFGCTR